MFPTKVIIISLSLAACFQRSFCWLCGSLFGNSGVSFFNVVMQIWAKTYMKLHGSDLTKVLPWKNSTAISYTLTTCTVLCKYISISIYGKGQQASTDGLKSIMSSLVWAKLLFWLWNAKMSVGDRNRKHGSLCPLPRDNNITLTKPYAKEMLSVMDYQTGQHFKLFQIDFHASLAWYGITGFYSGKSLWNIGSKIETAVYSFNTLSRTAPSC